MIHRLMTHRITTALIVSLAIPFGAHALDATPTATYQPVTRADLRILPPQAQSRPTLPTPVFSNFPTAAPNIQAGRRIAVSTGSREATQQISSATGISSGSTGRIVNGAVNGNVQNVARREATNTVRREGSTALARETGLARGDANGLVNGALNGNIQQAGTRIAVREGSREATRQISSATGISSGSTGRIVNGVVNGNVQNVARREATNTVRREGSTALARETGLARGDANALVNGALNGNIQQAGTRIAVREGSNALARETGLSRGLTGSLLGGLASGALGNSRGSRPSSPSFVQKNDYIAASDDGIIRYTSDGRLSSALKNSGFGDSGRFSLTPDGMIRDAAGQVTARMDRTTGKLFDAAGKEIAGNTLLANRIQSDIRTSTASPAQTATSSATALASAIPAGFNNSDWDATTRQKEWSSLPATQQAAWLRDAAMKSNFPTPAPSSGTASDLRLVPSSNQIVNANGTIVGRVSPSAISQFADARGTPISPNSPEYDAFKQLLIGR